MVTGGFSEKSSKIWGSFAQNFVYGHFQQPQWDAQSVFLHLICTVWIDWNVIWDVHVSYELNSKIFLFRPDGVPLSRKRSHGPFPAERVMKINNLSRPKVPAPPPPPQNQMVVPLYHHFCAIHVHVLCLIKHLTPCEHLSWFVSLLWVLYVLLLILASLITLCCSI